MIIRDDIKNALKDKDTFWLNLSILLFIALLPFNAFGFKLPFFSSFEIKFTEVAFLFVAIFGLIAYFQKKLVLQKAYFLYFFLFLQAFANFLSIKFSPHPKESLRLAIAISQYSVLVFILINVVHTETLRKAILSVMGVILLIIVGHSFIIYLLQGGVFHTRFQPSIVGNNIAHYLCYVLLMYGAGVLYLFFNSHTKWLKRVLFGCVILWLYVTVLPSAKIFQIATLLFLVILIITLNKHRKAVLVIIIAYIAAFTVQFKIVSISNTLLVFKYRVVKKLFLASKPEESSELLNLPEPAKALEPVKPSSVDVISPPQEQAVKPAQPPEVKPAQAEPDKTEGIKPSLLDEYSDLNKVKKRWAKLELSDSLELRIRGIITGLFMGASQPWTGVGVGQTRYFFDRFSNEVRKKADDSSFLPYLPFRVYIFTDKEWVGEAASIFNIFMNAWAETGIFGLIAIIGILSTVTVKGFRTLWKRSGSGKIETLRYIFPLFLVIVGVHQTIYLWAHPWLWTIIALTYTSADVSE